MHILNTGYKLANQLQSANKDLRTRKFIQPDDKIFQQRGGATWYDWLQITIFLVVALQLWGRVSVERTPSSEALIDNGADAPQVCLRIIPLRHENLWGHVHWRSAQSSSHYTGFQKSRKPKVS